MKFKAKIFKLGNSRAIYIPKEVYTGLKNKEVYIFEIIGVYTEKEIINPDGVEKAKKEIAEKWTLPKKRFNTAWCEKHDTMKGSCKCL